jgi:hypothetical protein
MGVKELPEIKCKFRYSGFARYVENCTFEWETNTLIGMERRKAGKFSNKIKRYSLSKMEGEVEVYA